MQLYLITSAIFKDRSSYQNGRICRNLTEAQVVRHLLVEVDERLDVLLDAPEQPLGLAPLADAGLADLGHHLLGRLLQQVRRPRHLPPDTCAALAL